MTPPQTSTEKCSKCGEVNPQKLLTCNLCGSVLPWVEAKRVAEVAEQERTAQEAHQLRQAKQHRLKHAPERAMRRIAKVFRFLPSFKEDEAPTVSLGDAEVPVGQLAAILGVVLLALASFAPLLNVLITSATLFTLSPWLGSANLCGAAVAAYALARTRYRWCYLAAILGLIGPFILVRELLQADNDLISPWRLLQWGVLPLILGPLACLVAAFCSETPEEKEDTASANPFGYDEATLFQNSIRQRIRDVSQTETFRRAVQANPDGIKAGLAQVATATGWAQVPLELKQLLEESEKKAGRNISGPTIPHAVEERKPFSLLRWGLAAFVPLGLFLLFWGLHSNQLKTVEPVSVDIGSFTYKQSKADAYETLTSALLNKLQETDSTYRYTPTITISGEIHGEGPTQNFKVMQKVIYDKGNGTIIVSDKGPLEQTWQQETIANSVDENTIPALVKQYQAKIDG